MATRFRWAGLLVVSIAACSLSPCMAGTAGRLQREGTADGWTIHHGAQGFTVVTPSGWTAEASSGKDNAVLMRSPDHGLLVVTFPFTVRGGSAREAVSRLVTLLGRKDGLFPNAQVREARQMEGRADEAIAKIAYNANGHPGEGSALVRISSGCGMFYAFGAPQELFARKRPELVRILSSFKYAAPAEPHPHPRTRVTRSVGNPAAGLSFTSFHGNLQVNMQDHFSATQERAFSVDVPTGWKATGAMMGVNSFDQRGTVTVHSPDDSVTVLFGDSRVSPFVEPIGQLAQLGMTEGQRYVSSVVMMRRPGVDVCRTYIKQLETNVIPNLRVEETADDRKVNAEFSATASAGSRKSGGTWFIDGGVQSFSFVRNGRSMRGRAMVVTSGGRAMGIGNWMAACSYLTAPPEKIALAEAVISRMIKTYRLDPAYQADIARAQGIAIQGQQENGRKLIEIGKQMSRIGDMIVEGYEQRQAVTDTTMRHDSNVRLGMTDLVDPESGEKYRAWAGHNYYFRAPSGAIVGNDSGDMPDIDFAPLREY